MKPKHPSPDELSDKEAAGNGQQLGVVLTGKETAGAVPSAAVRSMDA